MLRYVIRRVLFMIPTIIGVVILNFILFNVVGGSAASIVLGKSATAKDLDEFDEVRGYNKPLFFGLRIATRAFEDTDFSQSAGRWAGVEGASYATNQQAILLAPGEYELPVAFAYKAGASYEWIVTYTHTGTVVFSTGDVGEEMGLGALPQTQIMTISAHANRVPSPSRIHVSDTTLELNQMRLRRVMNNPLDSQFVFYVQQLLGLKKGVPRLGTSHSASDQPVATILKSRVFPTLCLTLPILCCGIFLAVVLSLACAFFHNQFIDRFFVVLSVALMSVNYMIWIVVGQYIFAHKLGWFPVWGSESWQFLVLPVVIGVMHGLGSDLRFYRTIVLDEMYKDYVRTAVAKGVSRYGVLFKHVLRNAMIPIVTSVIISIPFLYTGSLVLEQFFGIPGLGDISLNAINARDVDVLRSVVLLGAILFVVLNLVLDIVYTLVDPRVRLK